VTDHVRERIAAAVGDQYDVEAEIGRGGMSIVYRALDRRLRRHVAIKVLPPEFAFDPAVRERFRREAQTAAQLNHPNIIPIHSVDERDGVAYFAMQLCEGASLAALLAQTPRPALDEVRRVICEVADALAYAHARGVVHRDIKPDNILLDRDSGRAMVTDFGIARAAEAGTRLTVTGIAVGTPAYMSPEQALGEHQIDGRSDIYSLGVVGYQMLTGVTPFSASNTPAMLMKHVSEPPRPIAKHRRDAPPDLTAAIERSLAKGPEDRWQSAAELRDILSGRHVAAFAGRSNAAAHRPNDRHPALAAAGEQGGRAARRTAAAARKRSAPPEPLGPAERARNISDRIGKVRHLMVSYLGVSGMLFSINFFTQGSPWFIIPTAVLGADLLRRFGSLWADGIPMRYVFRRPRRYDADVLEELEAAAPDSLPYSSFGASGSVSGSIDDGGAEDAADPAVPVREPYRPPGRRPADALGHPKALTPREVREQMREAAQMRADVEEDRNIWGRATSLERRFRRFRRQTLTAAALGGLSSGLFVLAMATGGDAAPLFFLSLAPLTFSVVGFLRKALSLRRDDVDLGDVLTKPIDSLVREYDPSALLGQVARRGPLGMAGPTSPYMEVVRRAVADRAAILDAVRRMPKVDRRLLPDVIPTVNRLVERIAGLAPTLARLDADLQPNALTLLEERIAAAEHQGATTSEQERKIALLRRQRESLTDLVKRREMLLAQLESAGLLLQNLKLDLIKVRSSGVESTVQGVNNATQEARALSREIGYVLGAADEVRDL
jgi:serine/threonine-protein kinase